jgi:DNA-binding CsgD family transcriptional regulator
VFEEIILGNFLKEPRRPDTFISHIEKSLDKAVKKGGRPIRVLMALNADPFFSLTPSERIWIKASLNKLSLEKPVIMLTQHNVERISSRELLAIFRTHPTIVERGIVYKSPFYLAPGELMRAGENELDKFGMLSGKEKKVLSLITSGLSNSAIARELSISIKTVETHRANIMKKLDIHNLVDLVKYSMRKGLG